MSWDAVGRLLGVLPTPKQRESNTKGIIDLTSNAMGAIRDAKTPEAARATLELYKKQAGGEANVLLPDALTHSTNLELLPEPAVKHVERALNGRLAELDKARRGWSPPPRPYQPVDD